MRQLPLVPVLLTLGLLASGCLGPTPPAAPAPAHAPRLALDPPDDPVDWDKPLAFFDAVWWSAAPYRLLGATDKHGRYDMTPDQALQICKRELGNSKASGAHKELRQALLAELEAAGDGTTQGSEVPTGTPRRPVPSPLDAAPTRKGESALRSFDKAWDEHSAKLDLPPGGSAAQELAAREALRAIVTSINCEAWREAATTIALRERFYRLHLAAKRIEEAYGPFQLPSNGDVDKLNGAGRWLVEFGQSKKTAKELQDPAVRAALEELLGKAREPLEALERPHSLKALDRRADYEKAADRLALLVSLAEQTLAELGDIPAHLAEIKGRFPEASFDGGLAREHTPQEAEAWLERVHGWLTQAREDCAWLTRVETETKKGRDVAKYRTWFVNNVYGVRDRGLEGSLSWWRNTWARQRAEGLATAAEEIPAELLWTRHRDYLDRLQRGIAAAQAQAKHAQLFGGEVGDVGGDIGKMDQACERVEAGHKAEVAKARLPRPGAMHEKLAGAAAGLVQGRALRVIDDKITRVEVVTHEGTVVRVYDRFDVAYAGNRQDRWWIDYATLWRDVKGGATGEWKLDHTVEGLGELLEENISEP